MSGGPGVRGTAVISHGRVRRPWLLPVAPLYAAGVAWKNRGFDRHPERATRLRNPVISVGSLSAGGAGKTPFLIALAELMRAEFDVRVDVLSRGYGRQSTAAMRVDPAGTAAEFGDEPLLLARTLGCPVYVGAERAEAGCMADADADAAADAAKGPRIHLLDDGFQHRRLARALDVVLLTAEDAKDALLPAGNLREPLQSLHRASVVVLREDEEHALRPVLARVFRGRAMPPVWTIRRVFRITEGELTARPLAFCGLARPESFRASLENAGIAPAGFVAFRDHHAYTGADVRRLLQQAHAAGANGFTVTAKDAVKLSPEMRNELQILGPMAVGDLRVQIQNPGGCAAELRRLLGMLPAGH